MNPYAPKIKQAKKYLLDLQKPPSTAFLVELTKRLQEKKEAYDLDPFFFQSGPIKMNVGPDVYRISGRDISDEATLCELWSGEHDNAFMSEYICTLLNIAPHLIAEVLELRKRVLSTTQIEFEETEDYDLLKFMDRQLFPVDELPDFPRAQWYIARSKEDALVGFCGWHGVDHIDEKVGFHYRAGVMPEFQGAGVQKQMIKVREYTMRRNGLMRAVTYTDADNAASMRSLMSCGYLPYTPSAVTCLSGGLKRIGRVGFVHWGKSLV